MKRKWNRCILSILLIAGMSLGLMACQEKQDTEYETHKVKKSVEIEATGKAEPNSSESLKEALHSSDTLIPTETKKLFEIMAPDSNISTAQGGCSDGTYYYQAFYRRDGGSEQANNDCIVVKYDIKQGKIVAQTEILQLNHVNDMAYNSRTGLLVICHNAPFANLISYVKAETMEYVDTFPIDEFIYSIGYSAKRDQYMVGISGGQTFKVLDAEFKAVGEAFKPTSRSSSSTTQGGTCDDDFIYFTLHSPSLITVYDWNGNFVTIIELPEINAKIHETENMAVLNGEIYLSCCLIGRPKATVFKLNGLVPKPAEAVETQSK